jgi:hypothetical protein
MQRIGFFIYQGEEKIASTGSEYVKNLPKVWEPERG